MTMIADCREKYTKDAYPYGTQYRKPEEIPEDEINPYWEGKLNKENEEVVRGYDWAVEELDTFLEGSIDVAMRDYIGAHSSLQIDMGIMNDQRNISEFSRDEIKQMSKETYLLKAMHSEISNRLECVRNEMITSFIEGQDENNGH